MVSTSSTITTLGISILLVYGLTRVLEFYGIGINIYGSYIAFYIFIVLSLFILPRNYTTIKLTRA